MTCCIYPPKSPINLKQQNFQFFLLSFLSGMLVIKIAKQLNMFTPTEDSNESTLPSENEIVIIEPQMLLIHKFALCSAVQFLQTFYYSKLYNTQYNFPII